MIRTILGLGVIVAFCQPAAPQPTFEVASIKPASPGAGPGRTLMLVPGGGLRANNVTLRMLIAFAYDVKDFEISGAPNWLNSERYDINAKPDAPDEPASNTDLARMTAHQGQAFQNRVRQRLQALLADRFQLKIHRESKESPMYALVVAKNGPKLKEAAPREPPPGQNAPEPPGRGSPNGPFRGLRMGRGQLTGGGATLAMLANVLSNQLGRSVVDKTELKGEYDFTLEWTPEPGQGPPFGTPPPDAAPPPDVSGPSIFTALQEQLGLRLESAKGPVEILVVDHAEKPDEN